MKKGSKNTPETIAKMRLAQANRSLETREKMRHNHLGKKHTPETKEKLRLQKLGGKLSPEWRKNISLGLVGHKCSLKARKKLSLAMASRIMEGEGSSYRSGYFFSAKNGKKLHYRSSYELIAYKILEQMSEVASYAIEPFSIPYLDEKGASRRYIPDILVNYRSGRQDLIEVSSEWEVEKKKFKIAAGRHWCEQRNNEATFLVWTERQLRIA